MGYRLKQIALKNGSGPDAPQRVLPWQVKAEHSHGWVYHAAVMYAKWRAGKGVRPQDLKVAQSLEAKLDAMDAVLTYDKVRGFQIRNRKPEDSGLLV